MSGEATAVQDMGQCCFLSKGARRECKPDRDRKGINEEWDCWSGSLLSSGSSHEPPHGSDRASLTAGWQLLWHSGVDM